MNKILKLFLFGFLFINFINCKENPKDETSGQSTDQTVSQNTSINSGTEGSPNVAPNGTDPYMVETPPGYYEPQGLKKLNLLEMYKLGINPDFKKDFKLRDKDGKDVDWKVMEAPADKPMFMQMYVDENGKIVEAVVFPVTPEVKAMIAKVRMIAN